MNVLVLSAGSRCKTVEYFKRALSGSGRVIATDSSPLAPSLYVADGYHVVPRIDAQGYLDVILDICQTEQIGMCLSLIDPELELLAKSTELFTQAGVLPLISPLDAVRRAFDKWEMFRFCRENDIATPATWCDSDSLCAALNAGEASFPLFAKPATGSASANIRKVGDRSKLAEAWGSGPSMIVQEFMGGEPVDVDVYIDLITGEVVSLFAKTKLRMRAGTADKAISIKDPDLEEFVLRFCAIAGFRGPIDIDLFRTGAGYSLLEVNPRFGGVYPHAHECGIDFPTLALRNADGLANEPRVGAYEAGWAMLAYEEMIVTRIDGLEEAPA